MNVESVVERELAMRLFLHRDDGFWEIANHA